MFTEDQKKGILEKITEKAQSFKPCQICGHTDWVLQDGFVILILQQELGIQKLSGPGVPFLFVFCSNCGNTIFFNALVLGIQEILGPAIKDPNNANNT